MKEGGAAGLLNEGGGAAGLLNEGGGEQQASCLVAKQAVEFPQVYTSIEYYSIIHTLHYLK